MLKRAFPGSDDAANKSLHKVKKPCVAPLGISDSIFEANETSTERSSGSPSSPIEDDDYPTRPSTPTLVAKIEAEAKAKIKADSKHVDSLRVSSDAMCGFCRGPIHIRPHAFLRDHVHSDQRMCTPCSWALQRTAIMSSIRGIIQNPADQLRLQRLASRQHQAHMEEIDFFKRHNKVKPVIHPKCFNPQYLNSFPVFSPVYTPVELPPTPKISPNVLSMLSPCNVMHAPPLELTPPSSPVLQSIPLRRQLSTISRLSRTQSHGPSVELFG